MMTAAAVLGASWIASAQAPAAPLAEVNGRAIGAAEVDKAIAQPLSRLEEQIYALRRQAVERLINEHLLVDAAKARNLTLPALLDAEVTSKITMVKETEIEAFCAANPGQCGANDAPDAAARRGAVRDQLQRQKLASGNAAFIERLRTEAKIAIHLTPPEPFRADVPPGVLPARGPATAPVTIVEFSDFHCPFCRRAQATLKQVLAKYPTGVRLVYRDIPLDRLHPEARKAAEAARCANDQGKFWEFHDQVYAGPTDASAATLKALAEQAGLDQARFDQCVAGGAHKSSVQADAEYGRSLGITGTPSFFINGRFLDGAQPLEVFARIIDDELDRAKRTKPSGPK